MSHLMRLRKGTALVTALGVVAAGLGTLFAVSRWVDGTAGDSSPVATVENMLDPVCEQAAISADSMDPQAAPKGCKPCKDNPDCPCTYEGAPRTTCTPCCFHTWPYPTCLDSRGRPGSAMCVSV
jgi:hypothetical protein